MEIKMTWKKYQSEIIVFVFISIKIELEALELPVLPSVQLITYSWRGYPDAFKQYRVTP